MLIDSAADIAASPLDVEAAAVRAEADGYDGFGAPETRHDVVHGLTLAARATTRITLQSTIAVAFARNPMNVATLANDLQLISGGRFQLGLGSQVQPHIERRFAMPWSQPGRADGGVHRRGPGDLGALGHRRAPDVPRRVLPATP